MAVLQVYQSKLLRAMDESGPDPAAFKSSIKNLTNLALRATKSTPKSLVEPWTNLWSSRATFDLI